jgi:two-component system CheB/CheR fusion protein
VVFIATFASVHMKKNQAVSKVSRGKPKAARLKRAGAGMKGSRAGLSGTAARAAARAETIHQRADELHRKTEQVHSKAEETHRRVDEVHANARSKRVSGAGPLDAREEDIEIADQQAARGKPFPIVGIGASAGGYEAFTDLLRHLPKQTGMAFVLVQHLDPNHRSQLTELLSRGTELAVAEAKDGMEVEPDHVYVIPAATSMTLVDGRLRLGPRKESEVPPMPVDAFFRSLAEEQQERAIGIVMSGTGTDGTLGIEAIKGEGGITFAQHERSAKYFGMPGSAIGSGTVDFVLAPEEIARELCRIAEHPYLSGGEPAIAARQAPPAEKEPLPNSEKQMVQLFGLLRARTGVDFSFYKHSTLKRRIVRQMVLQKFNALGAYVDFLGKNPDEVDKLFNDLLINVTSFFRDSPAFQALKKKVFPRLVRAHTSDSPLRFWVCGCATGEEAYSLAISLVEFFDQNRNHRPAQIFASDISEKGITKARAGVYPENIVQDVSPERLRRFFMKVDGQYQVAKSIRDMVVFARQNMVMDPPFSNLDLITCRNVLIYLGAILQRKVLPVFHYSLRATGFLMLGSSETVGGATEMFSILDKRFRIYAKKQSYVRPAFEHPPQRQQPPRPSSGAAVPAGELRGPDLHTHVDKLVLKDFSPPAVVINAELDVLQFRGRTGDYLEHAPGTANLSLLRMAREGLVLDLRAGLTRAEKQDARVRQTGHVRRNGQSHEVVIEVMPFRLAPGGDRFFLVVFRETGIVTGVEGVNAGRPSGKGRAVHESQEMNRLKSELIATRETLQTIIEEQEANNEELKSANEEIQSSNEELQSTNEELETAKEELQSTNEELTTLNEELQTRNQELGTVLNDLTNLLASVNIPVVILDEALHIRRYTPMAERIFNLIPSDVGRRLSDLSRPIQIPDLDETVSNVINTLTPIERDVQDQSGRWYSLRIRPYRTRENKIAGAVLLLVDVDHLKRTLEMLLNTAKEPLVTLGPDFVIHKANDSFYKMFDLRAGQTEGRPLFEIAEGQWNILKLRQLLEEVLPQNKEVKDFSVDANFDGKPRKLVLNARRFYDEGWGMQMILLAFDDREGSIG